MRTFFSLFLSLSLIFSKLLQNFHYNSRTVCAADYHLFNLFAVFFFFSRSFRLNDRLIVHTMLNNSIAVFHHFRIIYCRNSFHWSSWANAVTLNKVSKMQLMISDGLFGWYLNVINRTKKRMNYYGKPSLKIHIMFLKCNKNIDSFFSCGILKWRSFVFQIIIFCLFLQNRNYYY